MGVRDGDPYQTLTPRALWIAGGFPMSTARERLTNLVELASQSAPEKQRALAMEVCDLLIDWPSDYSSAMRAPFEGLLGRVARGVDRATRRQLATRLAAYAETPLDLLNAFFFDLPLES